MGKKKILVVDDEAGLTHLVKSILEHTGKYEVREANGGVQGLEQARMFRPDLVLLDILMPDMDGSEVAQQLKIDPTLRQVPVVFLTAAVTKDEVASERGGMIGGHPFLAKPVMIPELLSCIEKQLAAGNARRQRP